MKRFLLSGFALLYVFALSAQNPVVNNNHISPIGTPEHTVLKKKQTLPSLDHPPASFQNPNTLSIVNIGTSVSAYGLSGNARTCLWADNTTNSVVFFHRLNGSESQGSSIGVDISKNGGQDWENNFKVYSPTGGPVPPQNYSQAAGRFPQGAIYNPSGNTNPNNIYAHYFIPALDGSNPYAPGGWGGIAWGVVKADTLDPPTQHNMASGVGFAHTIPNAFTLQDTLAFMVEPMFTGSEFSDTLILARGVWNNVTNDFNYSRQKITVPTNWKVTDTKIAFSPDGYYGYFSILSHNTDKPLKDSTYYPIIYRTTNAGQTWSGPQSLNLYGINGIPEIKNYLTDGDLLLLFGFLPNRDSLKFTTIGDHDLVVDMNGNPHIGVVISLSTGSFQSYVPSTCVVFDLYSLDGGNSWHGALLETIHNVWGVFGSSPSTLTEDNRVQLSRSADGTRIFASWIDTYPAASPSNNTSPDIFVVGLNMQDLTKTQVINVSGNSAAAGMAYMAVQSHIVFGGGGQYTIPFVYQSMSTANVNLPVQYKYIDDFVIDDSQFTIGFGNTLVTSLDNLSICKGNFVIPVKVINCNDVAAISLSLEYDGSMLSYIGYQNENPLLSSGSLIVNAQNQHVQISWYSLNPVNIGNDILCELVFFAVPGSTDLIWDVTTQAACEYTNINSDIIPSSFINGHINIADCGVGGAVTYDNLASTPLSNTVVKAESGRALISLDTTNSQGVYLLEDLDNGTYVISASTTKTWGGANSVDALMIQKYFAGFINISGMKLKAANVHITPGVNSVDALQIARRFVLLISTFPAGDWYFLKDTVALDSTAVVVNLKGICFGDVNGSYNPPNKEGPAPGMKCEGSERFVNTELIAIPVRVGRDAEIASISYIMNYKPDQIRIKDVKLGAEGTLVYNILPDQVRISWYSIYPMYLSAGDAIFTLLCETGVKDGMIIPEFEIQQGTLFSDFEGTELQDLGLNYPGLMSDPNDVWLSQNHPNPFHAETIFDYFIPQDARVTLKVFNLLGDCLYNETLDRKAGIHQGKISADGFAPGLYYYELTAEMASQNYRQSRRMVVTK